MQQTLQLTEYGARPRFFSPLPEQVDLADAQFGHELMGMEMLPQSVEIARLMEARDGFGIPLYKVIVIQMGRRSSKTTSTDGVLLGRMAKIEKYKIVETAQSQTIARDMFISVQDLLDEHFPDPGEETYQFKIGKGDENLHWKETRSRWHIVSPKPSSVRSKAADVVRIEEAGEIPIETGKRLLQGILPLMDTRQMRDRTRPVQLVIEGTPGDSEETLLGWALGEARGGRKGWGLLDYSCPRSVDPTNEETWPLVHPGLASGMTTMDTLRERLTDLGPQKFGTEYLCIDPVNSTQTVVDSDAWAATTIDHWLDLPDGASFGFSAEIDSRALGVVAAWYNADGQPCIQTIAYRSGTGWGGAYLRDLLHKRPAAIIGYDRFGDNVAVAKNVEGVRRFEQLRGYTSMEQAAGVSLLMNAIEDRTLIHATDADLDGQSGRVSFRYFNGSRLFARIRPQDNISLMNAAALALSIAASNRRLGGTYIPTNIQF